jgi:sulfate transport system ATP-binding protein
MSVIVRNITKRFGTFTALNSVSLEVRSGELVALLGPSGSGKTTLLRIIAGLEFPDPGIPEVLFHGEDVTRTPASQRKAGFAFQHYALFRHLTVFENIAFGLRVRPRETRPPESTIRNRVGELLKLIQLEPLGHRYPSQLSGGQRQRVALARALAVEPRVLLLDEPFGALDAKVRKELRRWLRQLHDEVHVTSIFVTHDQEEALEVADRVVVMNEGRIEQVGTPHEVYDSPANPFVFHFLGNVNLFRARIEPNALRVGDASIPFRHRESVDQTEASVYFRPHDVRVTIEPGSPASVAAVVRHLHAIGPVVRLALERVDDSSPFEVEMNRDQSRTLDLEPGSRVYVDIQKIRVFAANQALTPDDFSI